MEGAGEVDKATAALQNALGAVAAREADMARRNRELAALIDATRAIASSLDLEEILRAIVNQAASISGTPIVRLFLLDEEARVLRYRVGMGLPLEVEQGLAIPVGESFSGQVAQTGRPLAVADCREDPRLRYPEHAMKYGLISYLGLPVKLGDRVWASWFSTRRPSHILRRRRLPISPPSRTKRPSPSRTPGFMTRRGGIWPSASGQRETLRRYQLLAEHARDIVLFVRRDGPEIVEANHAALAAYGYTSTRSSPCTSTTCAPPRRTP